MSDHQKLKQMINDHLNIGKNLEKQSKRFGFDVPDEKLDGFRMGLRLCLDMIDDLENDASKDLTTKYNLGQQVWVIRDDEIDSFCISEIVRDDDGVFYGDTALPRDTYWLEEMLYPSREALIAAQIAYWTKLKCEEVLL